MQIANEDHSIVIDYQNRGESIIRLSTFHDGRTDKREFTKSGADDDALDLVENFDYQFI